MFENGDQLLFVIFLPDFHENVLNNIFLREAL